MSIENYNFLSNVSFLDIINFCLPSFLLVLGDANMYQRFSASKNIQGLKKSTNILIFAVLLIEILIIFPNENEVIQAWEVNENSKPIDHIESDTLGNSYLCSYVWIGTNVTDDLNKLFSALKENRLISDETESVSFLSAFNGVEISKIKKKI